MAPSSRIKVMIRLRPTDSQSHSSPERGGNALGPHATPGLTLPPHLLSIDCISNTISCTPPTAGGPASALVSTPPPPTTYQFEKILPPNTPNAAIYTTTTHPLILSALSGYNATLLTYGQTGAGKTYTTFGPAAGAAGGYRERGLCARAVGAVFDAIEEMYVQERATSCSVNVDTRDRSILCEACSAKHAMRSILCEAYSAKHVLSLTLTLTLSRYPRQDGGRRVGVCVSCVEIYNEHIYDLLGFNGQPQTSAPATNLNPGPSGNLGGSNNPLNATVPTLTLFESPTSGPQIRGLKILPVPTVEEGLNLLFESQMNRAIAEHQLNDASSRSHCLFTLHFTINTPQNGTITSKLNIVDLAGSERLKQTLASGVVQRESSYINKSLSFLEQVVVALASKTRDHIPYRQSKLTHVLKDSLGGNCNTVMIACVWPHEDHLEQTISTLKFAARMQVSGKPRRATKRGAMLCSS